MNLSALIAMLLPELGIPGAFLAQAGAASGGSFSLRDGIGAACAVGSVGTTFVLWLWRRAERAESRARQVEERTTTDAIEALCTRVDELKAHLDAVARRGEQNVDDLGREVHQVELRLSQRLTAVETALKLSASGAGGGR